MNIALIGASGYVGSALLKEALARGHRVTAIVSNPAKLVVQAGLETVKADVLDGAALASRLQGHDAVVSAFSGHAQADVRGYYVQGMRAIIAAAKQARVPRLLVVGGAGSLEVAPGVQLVDTPEFPAQWKGTAEGARDALQLLRAEPELEWTMLSPAAHLEPGERTGRFRLGSDQLLVDAQGASRISLADYAVVMIDELERPAHARRRFTVAY
ncbi:NAD(P)-dependent oxidoreductase [Aromatoleum petrolei]|uniref:NAD(P)H-binding protein n=1 Tax=Aromatoleum petrolei TaxID=76116 RepID=A0ABX1MUH0_9RHOO|nr:NAD(P)-dependent oxidoreductase [Aromatoleum petrolei]NMF90331.1 NAD(P)H-binding protein [Aromatoleum petrolei]QTQ37066.1 NAD(P)-binding domain-containing protein [Aromatoleum petrolei]